MYLSLHCTYDEIQALQVHRIADFGKVYMSLLFRYEKIDATTYILVRYLEFYVLLKLLFRSFKNPASYISLRNVELCVFVKLLFCTNVKSKHICRFHELTLLCSYKGGILCHVKLSDQYTPQESRILCTWNACI